MQKKDGQGADMDALLRRRRNPVDPADPITLGNGLTRTATRMVDDWNSHYS